MWATYRQRMQTKKKPRTLIEDAGLWSRYLEPWEKWHITEITVDLVEMHFTRVAGGKLDRKAKDSRGRERAPSKGARPPPIACWHCCRECSASAAGRLG